MQTRLVLRLKERGDPAVVEARSWLRVAAAGEADGLLKLGIVKVRVSGPFAVVEPTTLVGRYASPNLDLEVAPKAPELTSRLQQLLAEDRKKVGVLDAKIDGPETKDAPVWKIFERLVLDLLSEGLPWSYKRVSGGTSSKLGRVNFVKTISRFASRGITYAAFGTWQERKHSVELPSAVETIRQIICAPAWTEHQVASRLTRLTAFLGDAPYLMPQAEARTTLLQLKEEYVERTALQRLIEFGLNVLAASEPYRLSSRIGRGVVEFVDMERLWEHAVAMWMRRRIACGTEAVVLHPLRRISTTLFDDGGPRLDPDICLLRAGVTRLVADAKYSFGIAPSSNDVYQLTCYVERLGAEGGLLVYLSPDGRTSSVNIGTLESGSKLFTWSLSLAAFEND